MYTYLSSMLKDLVMFLGDAVSYVYITLVYGEGVCYVYILLV